MSASNVPPAAAPTREQVLADVRAMASQHCDVAAEMIRECDHFENDLGFDSLDLVEFTMEIEEHFEIDVPDDAAGELRTVRAVVDGVGELLCKPAGCVSNSRDLQ